MPWGQRFIPVWTGSGLDRVLAFGEEKTTGQNHIVFYHLMFNHYSVADKSPYVSVCQILY